LSLAASTFALDLVAKWRRFPLSIGELIPSLRWRAWAAAMLAFVYEGLLDLAKPKNEQQKGRIAELENFVTFTATSFAWDAAFVQKANEILAKGSTGRFIGKNSPPY